MNKLPNLDSMNFFDANKALLDFCEKKVKLNLEEIRYLLSIEEKELTESFLSNYSLFSEEDFTYIERFINENLYNTNKTFVSDFIYFASDFGLNLNYKKILNLLHIEEEDENCLVLSCLVYIHDNIKFLYIEELNLKLKHIIDNPVYHQNEQVLASLILYRISHNKDYLSFINELIAYDISNKEFLLNILKSGFYNPKYFNIKGLKENLQI